MALIINEFVASKIRELAAEKEDGYGKQALERSAEIIRKLETSVKDMTDEELLQVKWVGGGTVSRIRTILASAPDFDDMPTYKLDEKRFHKSLLDGVLKQVTKFLVDRNVKFELCGSYRRDVVYVKDLDFVVVGEGMSLFNDLKDESWVKDILWVGDKKMSVTTSIKVDGSDKTLQVDFRQVKDEHFGSCVLYFTGSKDFNIVCRQTAKKLGFTLNEYGLKIIDTEDYLNLHTEKEILDHLGIGWVKPKDRM